MALFGDDQGKTEKPTPSKLADVRKKGDTPHSKELTQGAVLFLAAIMLIWIGDWLVDALSSVMRTGMTLDMSQRQLQDIGGACSELWRAFTTVLPPFATLLLVLVATTALVGYGQIGIKISREAIGFKPQKLNPFTNMKRVFSPQSLMRTVFAAFKLSIIVTVLYFVLADRLPILLHLHEQPFATAAKEIGSLALTLLLWVGAVVTAMALADLAYQRYSFTKRNMMTKQEVDDERKRSEGDPTMKSRQKGARNELLRQRMMADVPRADVILTNPTHYSVALRYDRDKASAPMVVAKGVDDMAMQIRKIAREHDVPLMEDPPLTRALYRAVKVGQAVPEKFYQAVATVLSHVYRLKGRTA
ncbi:MAG: flagellar biosynthesis protein FlhB [Planctomycetes bacterium]|nr:flagellar biosynthesis protein FlhB [Planctomycetota bacterium]